MTIGMDKDVSRAPRMQLVEPSSRVLCLSGTIIQCKLKPPESSSKTQIVRLAKVMARTNGSFQIALRSAGYGRELKLCRLFSTETEVSGLGPAS